MKGFKCERLVSPAMIEQYAMSVARWIQCEEAISAYGLLGKHPTVSNSPIQSPFVAMSQSFMKQAQQIWEQIYQIVCENCSEEVTLAGEMDMMEMILRNGR
ncbi:MAG: P27 family phage terminase small subunit [Ruminococcus sp.]|nr:P27 family phage terminase small subunit [Ruminococcus sp.]